MAGIRRGGDCGRNYYRLHNHAGEDACFPGFAVFTLPLVTQARTPVFSALQSAFGDGQAFAVGATTAIITTAYTTTQATPGRENAAQPGNRRRRFARQRAQASSPAKRSVSVITTAYTTDAGEVACFPGFAVFTLPLVTLARSPAFHASAAGATDVEITDACVLPSERLRRWPCSRRGGVTFVGRGISGACGLRRSRSSSRRR